MRPHIFIEVCESDVLLFYINENMIFVSILFFLWMVYVC
jgi:hypothetical protein